MKARLEALRRMILDRLYEAEYGSADWHLWLIELRNVQYLLGVTDQ